LHTGGDSRFGRRLVGLHWLGVRPSIAGSRAHQSRASCCSRADRAVYD